MPNVRSKLAAGVVSGVLLAGGSVAVAGETSASLTRGSSGEYDTTLSGSCGVGRSLTLDTASGVFGHRQAVTSSGSGFEDGDRLLVWTQALNSVRPYGAVLHQARRFVRQGRWRVADTIPLREDVAVLVQVARRDACSAVLSDVTGQGDLAAHVATSSRDLHVVVARRSGERFRLQVRGNGAGSALWRIQVTVDDGRDTTAVAQTTVSGATGVFRAGFPVRLSDLATVTVVAKRTDGVVRRLSVTRNWFF